MPAAKLFSSGTLTTMKSEEGNDSIDNSLRHTIGKESCLPFSRTTASPVQWIQLLHALDQPDLPGWPLLTPLKIQMQKCEKCSQEFCSPINYRRHIRVHRRLLNVNKESHKYRDLLASFWDKLLLEQAKEVASCNDIMLKEVSGSSLIMATAASLRKPGVWSLPQAYVKAGSMLLNIIHAKSSRLPISSQELFSILDDASEKTFLVAGTAESVQKYVFDGETAKHTLELKNLIASTCFLFEFQLVKAWVADKDVEALRCQKILVEEEEAAQKRQAVILERKKLKKLRQKELKVKEQCCGYEGDLTISVDSINRPTSAETLGPSSPSDSISNSPDISTHLDSYPESTELQRKELDEDIEAPHLDVRSESINQGNSQITDPHMPTGKGYRHSSNRWQVLKSHRGGGPGFHVSQNLQGSSKSELIHKLGPSKNRNPLNGSKVWTKKLKTNSDGDFQKPPLPQGNNSHQIVENKVEVIIGSIPISLNSHATQDQEYHPEEDQDVCCSNQTMFKKKSSSEKVIHVNTTIEPNTRVAYKLWRPVSSEPKTNSLVVRDNESESIATSRKGHSRLPSGERSGQSLAVVSDDYDTQNCHSCSDENESLPFSSIAAKEFLGQRWKEVIGAGHVKLVFSDPPGRPDIEHDSTKVNHHGRIVMVKISKKTEKSVKIKYIPKQKAVPQH